MKVTPLEIRQKTFEKGFRGYEKEEVDAYLLTLSVEWEKMQEDQREQKHKIESLEREVQKMREVESSLYRTLKTAEDTGTHVIEQANKSAELILREAQMNADALLNDAKYNTKNLQEEAELKVKTMVEEAKDAVKISKRDIQEVESIKENMLIELRGIANETLEKVTKIAGKSKKNQLTESLADTPLFSKSNSSVEKPSGELMQSNSSNTSAKSLGSFFDNI
ncbi:MAG: DivIVA domain-containing protein [Cytophagales bacterium]